jgi:hypothetical protein
MIDEKIKIGIEFTDALNKWFDQSLPTLFDEVISHEDDLELYDDDEPLLAFENTDVIVSEKKMKAKIAEVILENRINDHLFQIEYAKSLSQSVGGYQ